jgi:hypothetical protein
MSLPLGKTSTPAWKLALIPVLLVVLFKVLRPTQTESAAPEARASVEAESPTASPSTRPASVLPELSLNEALAFDPFSKLALPVRVIEAPPVVPMEPVVEVAPKTPDVKPVVDRAAPLKQLKVSAVFPSSRGSMAIIDSKTVRVGDLLSPGVRVVEIRGMNVILRVEDGEDAAVEPPAETATR